MFSAVPFFFLLDMYLGGLLCSGCSDIEFSCVFAYHALIDLYK